MCVRQHFEISDDKGVIVIRFLDRQLVAGVDLAALWRELLQAIGTDRGNRLVLDFSLVDFLTSEVLGKLIALHKRVAANHGVLKLCCLCPQVRDVFVITKLDGFFGIEQTEAAALAALA